MIARRWRRRRRFPEHLACSRSFVQIPAVGLLTRPTPARLATQESAEQTAGPPDASFRSLVGTMSDEVRLLGVPGTARRLGICARSVFTLIARGELASLRVGRRRMIPSSAVDDFIASRVGGRARHSSSAITVGALPGDEARGLPR